MDEIANILQSADDQLYILFEQYVPNEKQLEMEQILDRAAGTAQVQTILMYGSPGSGKTIGAIKRMVVDANTYPGAHFGVFRRTFTEIFGQLLEPTEEFLRRYQIQYDRRLEPFPQLTFPNGSYIQFRSTEKSNKTKDGKADNLGGLELSGALIDEADSIKEEFFNTLLSSRMRQKLLPCNYLIPSCNPASEDSWLYKRFKPLLERGPGTFSDGRGWHSVHCPVDVNRKNLPEGYIENMEESLIHSPSLYKKFRLGLFGPAIIGHPVFGEIFSRDWHVASGPIQWNPDLPLYRSWDFGWRRPAVVVAQEDPKTGQITWLWCKHGHNELLHRFARRMLSKLKELFPGAQWRDFCDVDGRKRNPYTEKTQIQILQAFRLSPQATYSLVPYGLNLMADQLTRTIERGRPAMLFDPIGARELADAFEYGYTQEVDNIRDEIVPVKDGYYEHIMDAARYILVNIREVEARSTPTSYEKNKAWRPYNTVRPGMVLEAREFYANQRKSKHVRTRARYNFGGRDR